MTASGRAALAESLERVRFEVLPLPGVTAQLGHLPPGADVTVTASPTKGLDATLELAEQVAAQGLRAIPHLAARLVRDRRHLAAILRRLHGAGIDAAFVIAGDAVEPAGDYDGAAALLCDMAELGHELTHVGITGYPESHAFISDDDTITAMTQKAPHATHIVSQICFDPAVISGWVAKVRARGVELPIYLGVPGAVDRAKLLRISVRVGLGDSLRFLRHQHGLAHRLLAGYTPDDLIAALESVVVDASAGIAGWHLYTFNHVDETERWRQQLLGELRGARV